MKKLGIFLSIEGIEGVGKTTAVRFIEQYLKQKEIDFILTREPGGTEIAEQIRHILLNPNSEEILATNTELLLMFACRAQHIQQVILPALQEQKWVVCDRYIDASYAYQGGGRNISLAHIKMLDDWIVNELLPDKTILLDAPPEVGLARAKHRGPQDRIEQEAVDFFDRVRRAYLLRAEEDPKRFRVIDATKDLETVQDEIIRVLNE